MAPAGGSLGLNEHSRLDLHVFVVCLFHCMRDVFVDVGGFFKRAGWSSNKSAPGKVPGGIQQEGLSNLAASQLPGTVEHYRRSQRGREEAVEGFVFHVRGVVFILFPENEKRLLTSCGQTVTNAFKKK